MQSSDVVFREEQSFRQPLLWLILIAFCLLAVVLVGQGVYQQLIQGVPWGDQPLSNTALIAVMILMLLFALAFLLLFYIMALIIEVRSDGVFVRFRPFFSKTIPFSDIKQAQMRVYRPIREYGGWGIRYSNKYGRAYNIRGDHGVQLELSGAEKLLLGSQRAEELARLIAARI